MNSVFNYLAASENQLHKALLTKSYLNNNYSDHGVFDDEDTHSNNEPLNYYYYVRIGNNMVKKLYIPNTDNNIRSMLNIKCK